MLFGAIATAQRLAQSSSATKPGGHQFKIIANHADSDVARTLEGDLLAGIDCVERFFGRPFERQFEVEICPSRAKFDEYFERRWNLPKTQAWMVASGVADRLVILSPRVWKAEAVEHDPRDMQHIRQLMTHELVHVYHGQRNPRPDFDGMDEMGWFIEGLAVLVSGQLESPHRNRAAEAIKAGKPPENLASAWSGPYRYGVCGSLVEFVDARFGRDTTIRLLSATSNSEALRILNLPESDLLGAWRAHVDGD